MKRAVILLVIMAFIFSLKCLCQKPDDIVGYWLTIDEKTNEPQSQIQIFKAKDNKYYGKIVWLKNHLENNKPLLDKKNPDKELASKPVIGLQILKGFQFDDDEWEDGTIYDPVSGNTYDCKMWFEDNNYNLLFIRGYIGISLLGRSTQWKREYNKRN